MNSECACCAIAKDETIDHLQLGNGLWTLNKRQDKPETAWFVLQPVRHADSLQSLTDSECDYLGRSLRAVAQAMSQQPENERVVVLSLGDPGTHVHFHLTFRAAIVDQIDTNVAVDGLDRPIDVGNIHFEAQRDGAARSELVNAIAGPVKAWFECSWLPYGRVKSLLATRESSRSANGSPQSVQEHRRYSARFRAAEVYVLFWLILEVLLLAASIAITYQKASLDSSLRISLLFGFLAAMAVMFRTVDMVIPHLNMLLNRKAREVANYERSLILATLNIAEVVLCVSVVLVLFAGVDPSNALHDAYGLALLRSELPDTGTTPVILAADYVGSLVSVLILTAIISVVLGLISSSRFEELSQE